jgi:DNA-binding transcriptional MerR regulator
VSDGLLAIGTFSRASGLSVKALRAYHESGLLVPARVDPRTGYRAYGPAQLTDAAVIRRLRDLDLPLEQVRRVVEARDPEVTRRVLADHARVMRERLDAVTRIVAELQDGVDRPAAHTPVHLRHVDARHTLALRAEVTHEGIPAFLGEAYDRLGAAVERLGLAPDGPPGALYTEALADDAAEPVEAFLPLPGPVAVPPTEAATGLLLGEVPAATVAVATHAGGYDTIDATYRLLGAWVATNATATGDRVRESYLVSYDDTDDPSAFRTEIHWPVLGPTPEEPLR